MSSGFMYVTLWCFYFISLVSGSGHQRIRRLNDGFDVLSLLYSTTNGTQWKRKNNWLAGNPCPGGGWYGVTCIITEVGDLNLFDNQLIGSLPSQLGILSRLSFVSLGSNSITSSLPSQIGSFTKLSELYLFNNKLSGSLPSELGNLDFMQYNISLYRNSFSGKIPSELGQITRLREGFDIRSNSLSGNLPSQLGLLFRLTSNFDVSSNHFTGSIPSQLGNLELLVHGFYLFSNSFCGDVPAQVAALSSQVTSGFDVLTNSDNMGISCCIVEDIGCTSSPTSSPPSFLPTLTPSYSPSNNPSIAPSQPTIVPTPNPSRTPTNQPSFYPTTSPTFPPTSFPSLEPTLVPILRPTKLPTPRPTSPMPSQQPTTWIEAEPNMIGIAVGGTAVVIILLVIGRFVWKERKTREYMDQQIEMRPTAVTTSMMFSGEFKPPTSARTILPSEDLTDGNDSSSPQSSADILPHINNQAEYDEALFLRSELEAHGLSQFFTILWNLGVREPLQLQHVIKTDFDEANVPITLAQLKTLQRMGKKVKHRR